jgi:hypothetical protein
MTWYLSITALQEPYDASLDETGRQLFLFNVLCDKQRSETIIEEFVTILTAANIGTFGKDLFAGAQAVIPDGDGPIISIKETGGRAPLKTQNTGAVPKYGMPTVQIIVRAASYTLARSKANAAFSALVKVVNQDVQP